MTGFVPAQIAMRVDARLSGLSDSCEPPTRKHRHVTTPGNETPAFDRGRYLIAAHGRNGHDYSIQKNGPLQEGH